MRTDWTAWVNGLLVVVTDIVMLSVFVVNQAVHKDEDDRKLHTHLDSAFRSSWTGETLSGTVGSSFGPFFT